MAKQTSTFGRTAEFYTVTKNYLKNFMTILMIYILNFSLSGHMVFTSVDFTAHWLYLSISLVRFMFFAFSCKNVDIIYKDLDIPLFSVDKIYINLAIQFLLSFFYIIENFGNAIKF